MAAPSQAPQELDPISKFKKLVPLLKESLENLMKIGALILKHNAQVDSCVTTSTDSYVPRFDKALEEFYSICDQLELNLRLAIQCQNESVDSVKHSPLSIQVTGVTDPGDTQKQSYGQYIKMVKHQIQCVQEIHDSLVECARKISERQ